MTTDVFIAGLTGLTLIVLGVIYLTSNRHEDEADLTRSGRSARPDKKPSE